MRLTEHWLTFKSRPSVHQVLCCGESPPGAAGVIETHSGSVSLVRRHRDPLRSVLDPDAPRGHPGTRHEKRGRRLFMSAILCREIKSGLWNARAGGTTPPPACQGTWGDTKETRGPCSPATLPLGPARPPRSRVPATETAALRGMWPPLLFIKSGRGPSITGQALSVCRVGGHTRALKCLY